MKEAFIMKGIKDEFSRNSVPVYPWSNGAITNYFHTVGEAISEWEGSCLVMKPSARFTESAVK